MHATQREDALISTRAKRSNHPKIRNKNSISHTRTKRTKQRKHNNRGSRYILTPNASALARRAFFQDSTWFFLSRPGHWPFTRLLLPHAMANTASSNVPVESCVIREKAQRAACAVPQTSTPCHWLGTTSLQIKRAQARHTRHLSISRLLETAGCGSRRSSIGLGDC